MPNTSYTIDLTGSGTAGFSLSYSVGGIDLVITSGLFNGDTGGDFLVYENTPVLNQTASGLGMLNPYGDAEVAIDGDGKKEVAIFSFSQVVHVTSIILVPMPTRFNETATDVSFRIFLDDLVAATGDTDIDLINGNNPDLYGDLVGIGAQSRFDGFRIAAITFELPLSAAMDDFFSATRGASAYELDVLANDTDAELITAIDTTGLAGNLTIGADGRSLVYDAAGQFAGLTAGQTAEQTFTYTVRGYDGDFHTSSVTLTIRGVGGQNFLTGTSANNTLNGGALGDTIAGLSGNDTLKGGGGDDLLEGGAGRDSLRGEAGGDEMAGGQDDDTYYVDDAGDVAIELANQGKDRVYSTVSHVLSANVEILTLQGSADIDGSGNSLANTITGNAGSNALFGGDGNDTLDGGLGDDSMFGGAGNDKYYVDSEDDYLAENNSEGSDTVYATASCALAVNVENLTLQGGADLSGTGNSGKNALTGNTGNNLLQGLAGADKIKGGDGDDILSGGLGRDTLTGGTGADHFVFAEFGSKDYDTIADFEIGIDKIGLVSTAVNMALGALDAGAFVIGAAALDSADRIIYDQARGDIYYDVDGTGSIARQLVASVADGTILDWSDFLIIDPLIA